MDKKEIIARLQANPTSPPTLEEVDFILADNMRETLELSIGILERAKACHYKGEEYLETSEYSDKFFELEKEFLQADADLWEYQKRTEIEWNLVRKQLESILEAHDPEEFYNTLLEWHDESQMTKH